MWQSLELQDICALNPNTLGTSIVDFLAKTH